MVVPGLAPEQRFGGTQINYYLFYTLALQED